MRVMSCVVCSVSVSLISDNKRPEETQSITKRQENVKMLYINLLVAAFLLSMCQLTLSHWWKRYHKWDHFMFVQEWPPGTCADAPKGHHSCYIPMKVKTWTIHGLWPCLRNTKKPASCDNTWKFDITKIDNLRSELDTYWPNMYTDTDHTGFWSHEWQEHGTCCADLPSTAGEEKYFKTSLMLNKKYNLLDMLKQNGVVPSETAQYSYEDFVGAIQNATGFQPVIQCTTKKLIDGTRYHLIDQINICLNKDFTPRSCDFYSNSITFPNTKLKDHFSSIDLEKGALIGRWHHDHGRWHHDHGRWHHDHGRWHRHHDHGSKSNCPRKYKISYPPIHQNLRYN